MSATTGLARSLGLCDVTMLVMGGILGSGTFINTYVVARRVHPPFPMLSAWLLGALSALVGAFVSPQPERGLRQRTGASKDRRRGAERGGLCPRG